MKNKIKGLFALSTVAVLAACGAKSKWSASNYEDTKVVAAAAVENAETLANLTPTSKISLGMVAEEKEEAKGVIDRYEKSGTLLELDLQNNLFHQASTGDKGKGEDSFDMWVSYNSELGIINQVVEGDIKAYTVIVSKADVEAMAELTESTVDEVVNAVFLDNYSGIFTAESLSLQLADYVDAPSVRALLGLTEEDDLKESYKIAGDKSALIDFVASGAYDDGDYDVKTTDQYTFEINDLVVSSVVNIYTEVGSYYVDAETKVPYSYKVTMTASVKTSFTINVPSLDGFILVEGEVE